MPLLGETPSRSQYKRPPLQESFSCSYQHFYAPLLVWSRRRRKQQWPLPDYSPKQGPSFGEQARALPTAPLPTWASLEVGEQHPLLPESSPNEAVPGLGKRWRGFAGSFWLPLCNLSSSTWAARAGIAKPRNQESGWGRLSSSLVLGRRQPPLAAPATQMGQQGYTIGKLGAQCCFLSSPQTGFPSM